MTFFYLCIYVIKWVTLLLIVDTPFIHLVAHRIMMTGIYDGHQANAAFIVCGPPGFTTLALIHLSEHAREM